MLYIKGEKPLKQWVLPLVLALILPTFLVQAAPSPETLSFEIYTDGTVKARYVLSVDPTKAQENVTIFGEVIQDLFVYDEEGLLLGSEYIGGYLQVDTLGSETVDITYLTSDLTGKIGAIWSIDVTTPISTEVTLPLSSTIINLNQIPLEIETVEEQTKLVMPAGDIIVSYTIDIKDSKTIAEEEIVEAQRIIDVVKESGAVVPTAEEILAEAITAYEEEDYVTAYEKAYEAGETAGALGAMRLSVWEEVERAREAVQAAEEAGNTIGLDNAKELLEDAEEMYAVGDYVNAANIAESATVAAQLATQPESQDNTVVYIGALVAIGAIVIVLLRSRRTESPPAEDEIELERLFEEHPELRLDDKEALRYMAEHGGEAFAHEVRDRLDIPRTSAWRMVQRLQRFEVITERKVGGQSLLSIVDEYRRKKQ